MSPVQWFPGLSIDTERAVLDGRFRFENRMDRHHRRERESQLEMAYP